jgi:hypothetical protein
MVRRQYSRKAFPNVVYGGKAVLGKAHNAPAGPEPLSAASSRPFRGPPDDPILAREANVRESRAPCRPSGGAAGPGRCLARLRRLRPADLPRAGRGPRPRRDQLRTPRAPPARHRVPERDARRPTEWLVASAAGRFGR